MTPAARAEAAIGVLDRWLAGQGRAERLLREWGRASRYAGSKDRRAVADIVYDCIRRKRSLAWASGARGGRALIHGLALADGWDVDAIFSGARHAPQPLTVEERAGRAARPPDPVRHDYPDWLETSLKASLGDDYEAAMAGMGRRAPTDLRVNRLKADAEEVQEALLSDGVEAARIESAPDGLRAPPGARIATTRAYLDGLVELQDAASQQAVALAEARPGEAVLDYCAGGGGKTLALAAATGGEVDAHDVEPRRMRDLPERARRAGAKATIVSSDQLRDRLYDLVFVDAPCSGSGSWRRDPEGKWALTPEILAERERAQREAFAAGLAHVRAGGRIAYATCSLLVSENEAIADWATTRFPELSPLAKKAWRDLDAGDGFFCVVFRRN